MTNIETKKKPTTYATALEDFITWRKIPNYSAIEYLRERITMSPNTSGGFSHRVDQHLPSPESSTTKNVIRR